MNLEKIAGKVQPNRENLVLHINGGLGKCIMATAVIRSYKVQHPTAKVVVVSGYPEVFLHNPDVYRNFHFNTPYLWQDFYGHDNYRVYAHDPYFNQQWIKNEEVHLIQVWCDELQVKNVQNTPLLYFSSAEVDELQSMVRVDKPLIVIQSTGGANAAARSWTRNPPLSEFEQYLSQFKDDCFMVHLCVPETPQLINVHQRIDNLDRRKAMCLVYYCHEFIGLDSFGLHTRAANEKAGNATFFFPLAETVSRLGYERVNFKYLTPTKEVQKLLRNHHDYYATVFKLSIEDSSENCPVPPGTRWFEF